MQILQIKKTASRQYKFEKEKLNNMQVICLQDEAFYALLDQVVQRIKQTQGIKEDKWISPEEAMKKLRITSKTPKPRISFVLKERFIITP